MGGGSRGRVEEKGGRYEKVGMGDGMLHLVLLPVHIEHIIVVLIELDLHRQIADSTQRPHIAPPLATLHLLAGVITPKQKPKALHLPQV